MLNIVSEVSTSKCSSCINLSAIFIPFCPGIFLKSYGTKDLENNCRCFSSRQFFSRLGHAPRTHAWSRHLLVGKRKKLTPPSFFHRLVQSSAAQLTPILTGQPSGPEDECRVGSRSPKKRENCWVWLVTAHLNYTEMLSQFSKHFLQDKKRSSLVYNWSKHRFVVNKTFQGTCSQFHQAGEVFRALFLPTRCSAPLARDQVVKRVHDSLLNKFLRPMCWSFCIWLEWRSGLRTFNSSVLYRPFTWRADFRRPRACTR